MKLKERITLITKLGQFFQNLIDQDFDSKLDRIRKEDYLHFQELINDASYKNRWFTNENIQIAIKAWTNNLQQSNLVSWLDNYPYLQTANKSCKTVAIIMAGNIPLVGFHDLLSVFFSGHKALCKLSSDDQILLPAILNILTKINPEVDKYIELTTDMLGKFDAVIATGSNNTSRYFEYYFGKYPNIIRKNRNSVAILTGNETKEELEKLGDDIFQYFGMGCRNVSKLYVPQNFEFRKFFEAVQCFDKVQFQSKYMNNYDFHKSIYLVNKVQHLDNGFCLLKEDNQLASPISVIYYEYYTDLLSLTKLLKSRKDEIQCLVAEKDLTSDNVCFGDTQKPNLMDYADGVDTLNFLVNL